jgi:hypothetical protein
MDHLTCIRRADRGRTAIRVLAALAGVLILVLAHGPPAPACTTPVYRVAMYNWTPAPHRVFYLHRGAVPGNDQTLNAQIAKVASDKPPANLEFQAVDVGVKEQLDGLPEAVRRAWKSHEKLGLPLHLVFSAWGAELSAGRLDAAEVAKIVDSPARKRLAELLHEGNAAVLVVLGQPRDEKTRAAEKTVAEVVAQAAAGKIAVAAGAPDESPMPGPSPQGPNQERPEGKPGDSAPAEGHARAPPGLNVATLSVLRTDPAEAWLVRSLMSVETDLGKYAAEPMVFAVFGRGRVLPPFIGRGITAENLTEAVSFVAGACSCTVKDQAPGWDLLVRWDWAATAETLAASDPTLRAPGGWGGYQEFTPGETGLPGGSKVAADQVSTPAGPGPQNHVVAGGLASRPPQPKAGVVAQATGDAASKPPALAAAAVDGASPADPGHEERPRQESFAVRQGIYLGFGLGVLLVVVVIVGLIVVRRVPS